MKKQVLAILAGGIAAALPAAPASASIDAGAQARIYDVGRCVVRADRSAAASLLRALPLGGGDVDMAGARRTTAAHCFKQDLPTRAALPLRGAIAQEMYLTDFRESGMEPRRRLDLLADLGLPTELNPSGTDSETNILYALGDCVVRNDTENTDRLLKTPVGSQREKAIIDRLTPYMSACINADAQVGLDRSEMRSVLAQSAYNASARYWTGRLGNGIQR